MQADPPISACYHTNLMRQLDQLCNNQYKIYRDLGDQVKLNSLILLRLCRNRSSFWDRSPQSIVLISHLNSYHDLGNSLVVRKKMKSRMGCARMNKIMRSIFPITWKLLESTKCVDVWMIRKARRLKRDWKWATIRYSRDCSQKQQITETAAEANQSRASYFQTGEKIRFCSSNVPGFACAFINFCRYFSVLVCATQVSKYFGQNWNYSILCGARLKVFVIASLQPRSENEDFGRDKHIRPVNEVGSNDFTRFFLGKIKFSSPLRSDLSSRDSSVCAPLLTRLNNNDWNLFQLHNYRFCFGFKLSQTFGN